MSTNVGVVISSSRFPLERGQTDIHRPTNRQSRGRSHQPIHASATASISNNKQNGERLWQCG